MNGNGSAVPVADKERATAVIFLNNLLPKAIDGSVNLAQAIARANHLFDQHKLLGKFFTAASPEVLAHLAAKFGDEAQAPAAGQAEAPVAVASEAPQAAPEVVAVAQEVIDF